jgi:hypothetical protein
VYQRGREQSREREREKGDHQTAISSPLSVSVCVSLSVHSPQSTVDSPQSTVDGLTIGRLKVGATVDILWIVSTRGLEGALGVCRAIAHCQRLCLLQQQQQYQQYDYCKRKAEKWAWWTEGVTGHARPPPSHDDRKREEGKKEGKKKQERRETVRGEKKYFTPSHCN